MQGYRDRGLNDPRSLLLSFTKSNCATLYGFTFFVDPQPRIFFHQFFFSIFGVVFVVVVVVLRE